MKPIKRIKKTIDIGAGFTRQAIDALLNQRNPLYFNYAQDSAREKSSAEAQYEKFYGLDRFNTQAFHGFGFLPLPERPTRKERNFPKGKQELVELAVHYWLPENPVASLYVLHGYYDHVGLFANAIAFGLENNYAVITFDLPGHGLSGGEPAVIDDFQTYSLALDTVLEASKSLQLTGPKLAFAQSTGCAVLLKNQLDKKQASIEADDFDAQVLLAPLVRPRGWRSGQYLHLLLKPFVTQLRREFALNSHDENFLAFLRHDPLQSHILSVRWVTAMKAWLRQLTESDNKSLSVPTLIVQGKEDTTVDWRFNIPVLEQKLRNMSLLWLGNARHQLINETESVRDQYMSTAAAFLKNSGKG
ncbi:alpha/beta hydrolase [Simiduia curdlanivorans]|uniref:Alpha/beta hydrolase n=1 Tax=Simiduia curdlanivorans TaxID=1492769 RepID=A0ABV8V0W7_9GAMM|nr:alpha/beta hydrolase [Simiduia curdlanivorans]MDN3637668.1 alpha/beta hydrolase [Simiduia curdlanivorans]